MGILQIVALAVRAGIVILTVRHEIVAPDPTNGIVAVASVPEPSIWLLVVVGLGTMVLLACRR